MGAKLVGATLTRARRERRRKGGNGRESIYIHPHLHVVPSNLSSDGCAYAHAHSPVRKPVMSYHQHLLVPVTMGRRFWRSEAYVPMVQFVVELVERETNLQQVLRQIENLQQIHNKPKRWRLSTNMHPFLFRFFQVFSFHLFFKWYRFCWLDVRTFYTELQFQIILLQFRGKHIRF